MEAHLIARFFMIRADHIEPGDRFIIPSDEDQEVIVASIVSVDYQDVDIESDENQMGVCLARDEYVILVGRGGTR